MDGTTQAQFHPHTGQEISWVTVKARNKRIKKAYWLPFGKILAKKILAASGQLCFTLPFEARLEAAIPPGADIIIKRKGMVDLGVSSVPGGKPRRGYVLGFKYNGETHVVARDSFGKPVSPEKVASWIRGVSVVSSVGAIEEKD